MFCDSRILSAMTRSDGQKLKLLENLSLLYYYWDGFKSH